MPATDGARQAGAEVNTSTPTEAKTNDMLAMSFLRLVQEVSKNEI